MIFYPTQTVTPQATWGKREVDSATAQWSHNFVVTAIVHWQTLGLSPKIPEGFKEATRRVVGEDDFSVDIIVVG
jgi:hypothetical protein